MPSPSISIEYRRPDIYSPQEVRLSDLLEAAEGRGNEPLMLEADDPYHGRVCWSDRGLPQLVSCMVEAPPAQ